MMGCDNKEFAVTKIDKPGSLAYLKYDSYRIISLCWLVVIAKLLSLQHSLPASAGTRNNGSVRLYTDSNFCNTNEGIEKNLFRKGLQNELHVWDFRLD